ncbi:hypothetical protein K7W42_15320 [Deinococcus sp. HMF7604]|nr:hypothetical protein [Deinococcus betulae]MBZ9752224.1 hypothetical protein [Deinococcus betulae]
MGLLFAEPRLQVVLAACAVPIRHVSVRLALCQVPPSRVIVAAWYSVRS